MSEKQTYPIKCPKCSHAISAELYDAINVKNSPDLKDQLLKNQINSVVCPQCELAFRVDKPMLYSDPDHGLLIYLLPTSDDGIEEGEDRFSAWMRATIKALPDRVNPPNVHLVFNRTELVERIFLKEAGLDERLVEYIKYLVYSRNAAKFHPVEKVMLFNAQDSTEENLRFVVQDVETRQFEAMLDYSRSTYQALVETFGDTEKTADLLELFPGPYISARALILRELETEEPLEPDSE